MNSLNQSNETDEKMEDEELVEEINPVADEDDNNYRNVEEAVFFERQGDSYYLTTCTTDVLPVNTDPRTYFKPQINYHGERRNVIIISVVIPFYNEEYKAIVNTITSITTS